MGRWGEILKSFNWERNRVTKILHCQQRAKPPPIGALQACGPLNVLQHAG